MNQMTFLDFGCQYVYAHAPTHTYAHIYTHSPTQDSTCKFMSLSDLQFVSCQGSTTRFSGIFKAVTLFIYFVTNPGQHSTPTISRADCFVQLVSKEWRLLRYQIEIFVQG